MSHQSNDVEILESVFSATDVLYACMDTNFNFIRVNRAYAEADGRDPEFYVGKNHFDLFPCKDNRAIFNRVVETGEPHSAKAKAFEYAEHPERGVSYWDWTLHPVKDSSGKVEAVVLCLQNANERVEAERKLRQSESRLSTAVESLPSDFFPIRDGEEIVGIQGMNIDISERRRAEKALRKSEEMYRTLVETSPDAIVMTDLEANILRANRQAALLAGYEDPEDLIGHKSFDYVAPEDRELAVENLMATIENGSNRGMEYTLSRRDGSTYPAELSASVIRNEAGGPKYLMAVMRDITERRRAEEELEKQRVLAIASDRLRSLGEMATGIAHELNQPLVGVRGLAEHVVLALEREWELSKEGVREKLQKIVEQADRMSYIIEHVRMFAREADRPEMYPVNLNELVESSLGLVCAQLRQRGLVLEYELAGDVPDVEANQYALEEVILNLVTNARDAMEQRLDSDEDADAAVTLRTSVEEQGGKTWVKVEVADRGVGITAEQLDRVFEPFFTTKSPDKGTGLGLAISRSIIEKSGGTIEIRSEPGVGTTATVSLPAIRDE